MTLLEKSLIAAIGTEFAAPLSIFVLQPGFDHPNALGLDWGFVVLMFWVFGVSWAFATTLALICRKKVRYLVVQGLLFPVFAFVLWCGHVVYLQ